MKKTVLLLAFAFILLCSLTYAQGEYLYEHFSTGDTMYISYNLATYQWECTNFTMNYSDTITPNYVKNVSIYVGSATAVTGQLWAELWSSTGTVPNNYLLNGTKRPATTLLNDNWNVFQFEDSYELQPDIQYWICIVGDTAQDTKIFWKTLPSGEVSKASGDSSTWGNYGKKASLRVINFTSPPSPPVENTVINLTLLDSSGNIFSDSFEESDEFTLLANYTTDNVFNTGSYCSFESENISYHNFYEYDNNLTLQNSTYKVGLTVSEDIENSLMDLFEIRVCKGVGFSDNILALYINETLFKTYPPALIPVCSTGNFLTAQNISEVTKDYTYFNFSYGCINCNAGNPGDYLTLISDEDGDLFHISREFSYHNHSMTEGEENYYFNTHRYVFENPGNYYINVTCNDTETQFDYTVVDVGLNLSIVSINDINFTDGLEVEDTGNLTILAIAKNDIIVKRQLNLTYLNGTLIKSSDTSSLFVDTDTFTTTGIFNISFSASDDEGNDKNVKGWFVFNDTIYPIINWISPVISNTSTYYNNSVLNYSVLFKDENLFAYEIIFTDPDGNQAENKTETGLTSESLLVSDLLTLDKVGIWTIHTMVSDSHTDKEIKDYKYKLDDKKLVFDFERVKDYKKIKSNVTIEYDGIYDILETDIKKEKDRYTFNYVFDIQKDYKDAPLKHKFRITCNDPIPVKSQYIGHIVCLDEKVWIDFESENVLNWDLYEVYGGYEIELTMNNADIVSFHSIGGLNIREADLQFEVLPEITETTSIFGIFSPTECRNETTQDVFFNIFMFLILAGCYMVTRFKIKIPFLTMLVSIGGLVFFMGLYSCQPTIMAIMSILCILLGLEHLFQIG